MRFKFFLEQIIKEEAILSLDNIGVYYSTRDDLLALYELNDGIKDAINRNDIKSFTSNFKILGVMFFAQLSNTKFDEIVKVASENGYGPLLYLLAMQISKNGLMPDPNIVSNDAKNIWSNFFNGKGKDLVTPIATIKNKHQEPYLKVAYKNKKTFDVQPLIKFTDKIASGQNNYKLAIILHNYIDNRIGKIAEETLKGGLSDDKSLQDLVNDHKKKGVKTTLEFLKDQLKKGMKVESEHTTDVQTQKEIAKDHLSENPNYYIELEKIEKE